MKVLIRSNQLREVKSQKTGQLYFIQSAALESGLDFPKPFDIMHDDWKKAYVPGEYTFAPDAVYVDRNGRLAISPRLLALVKPAAVAKSA